MPSKLLKSLWIVPVLLFAAGCRGNVENAEEGGATASAAPGIHAPRRVFFITVDTLRADHMSLYGYPRETTPNLQKLAAGGVTFDHAVCQWPKTGSSFASMFTGLYPHTTGLTHKAALRIPEPYLTLPELFKDEGYSTFGVVSNAVLASQFGWNTGFDEFQETWGGGEFPDDPKAFRPLASALRVNDLAVPLLRKYAKADKLFAWIHYSDPHAPYILPEGSSNPFAGDAVFRTGTDRAVPARITKGYTLEGRTDLKYYVSQYDANVLVADAYIRKLLDEMRSLGLLEDSLIIFAADHGEELGEHNSWFEHGPLPYNTTAHVPLFFVMDGLRAGRRVDRPVELVDLYPTLRDLIAPDRQVPGLEGKSLWPLLRDGDAKAFRQAFSEAGRRPNLYHSVQEPAWKLVFNSGGKRSRAATSSTGGFELYNLKEDPLEARNLAAVHPEEVRRLRRDLVAWMRKARSMGDDEEGDPETERALRALGYLN
ncbi:MAG TPA: sulfatase [Thermoanaerobaculia bacterium]|jgi:arylsulfatase A-like enzyme|nr:sulfatase [Thermoanaerobaculia bacterium]